MLNTRPKAPLYFLRYGLFHKAEVWTDFIPNGVKVPVYVDYLGCKALTYAHYVVH